MKKSIIKIEIIRDGNHISTKRTVNFEAAKGQESDVVSALAKSMLRVSHDLNADSTLRELLPVMAQAVQP